MLVITTDIGKKIHIGDNIVLDLKAIIRNQVKIGIDSPKNIVVMREEIIDKPLDKLFVKDVLKKDIDGKINTVLKNLEKISNKDYCFIIELGKSWTKTRLISKKQLLNLNRLYRYIIKQIDKAKLNDRSNANSNQSNNCTSSHTRNDSRDSTRSGN